MRCPRCQFENMPGLDRCFQCGSALQAESGAIAVEPPRMAGWKRPFRNLLRRARGWHVLPQVWRLPAVPGWLRTWTGEGFLGILLSVVPGLAHWFQGRFGPVRRWIAVWAVLLFLALFFYGGFWGMMYLGFALGVHAWIACSAGFFREHEDFGPRFIAVIVVSIVLFNLYGAAGRMVFTDIVGGYSGVTVPFHRVQVRDFLLARRSLALPEYFKRGSLVAVDLQRMTGGRNPRQVRNLPVLQVAEIIALPGEKLELVKNEGFRVNGMDLDPDVYPVPGWLHGRSFSVTIPPGSYFVAAEYRGIRFTDLAAVEVSTIPIDRIEGKAILRWSPVLKRGWIRDPE
jgi:hypothetical protein